MYKFNELSNAVQEELREFYITINDTAEYELENLTSKNEALSQDAGFYDVEYYTDGYGGSISCKVDLLEYLTYTKQKTYFKWLVKYLSDTDKYNCQTDVTITESRTKFDNHLRYGYPNHFDNCEDSKRLWNKWDEITVELMTDIIEYCRSNAMSINSANEAYIDAVYDDTFQSMFEGELFTIDGIRCDYTFIQKGEADERIKALLNHIYSVSLADGLVVVETTKNNVYDSVIKVEETYTFGCDSFHTKSDPTTCFVVRDATFDIRSLYNTFVCGYTRGQFYEVTNDELL